MTREELLGRISDLLRRSHVDDAEDLIAELEDALGAKLDRGETAQSFGAGAFSPPPPGIVVNRVLLDRPAGDTPRARTLLVFKRASVELTRGPMPRYGIPFDFRVSLEPNMNYEFCAVPDSSWDAVQVPLSGIVIGFEPRAFRELELHALADTLADVIVNAPPRCAALGSDLDGRRDGTRCELQDGHDGDHDFGDR